MQKLGAMLLLGGVLSGCGEDGQGIREADLCPAQPLYHYEFVDGGGKWVPRHADHSDFSNAERDALEKAITAGTSVNSGGPRCLTPAGNAKTLDAGN
jgi:hypothetical protein